MTVANQLRTIRVLHIYRTYFPETQGGLQESIRQLCLATHPLGVENSIFVLAKSPEPKVMALPEGTLVRERSWFEIGSCDFGGWSAVRSCRKLADQCDIIQIHFPWPFADFLLPFIRKRGQPVIVTYVSDIVRQRGLEFFYAPVRHRLLSVATRVVASTPNYAATSPVLQNYLDKLVCIPHCLGGVANQPPDRLAHWKLRLGREFFLFVGMLRYYKGLEFLLDAATRVDSLIVIVGDGPMMASLRAQIDRQGITNVLFLGALSDADKLVLFELCLGVVFPSHLRSEAFGMTLLEGARAGKPLISCEIGTGTSWINRHNETGLVVAPMDSDALAKAMNTLATNEELRKQMGVKAQERWQKLFTPDVVGRQYRQLYDNTLLLGNRV